MWFRWFSIDAFLYETEWISLSVCEWITQCYLWKNIWFLCWIMLFCIWQLCVWKIISAKFSPRFRQQTSTLDGPHFRWHLDIIAHRSHQYALLSHPSGVSTRRKNVRRSRGTSICLIGTHPVHGWTLEQYEQYTRELLTLQEVTYITSLLHYKSHGLEGKLWKK